MKYRIKLEKQAVKFISKQPESERKRIFAAIYQLPHHGDIKAMRGRDENYYRLRVGDYRIIYTVHHDIFLINVVKAGNRGDIYK